jgi:DNA-binding NtrC family response regulator
MGQDMKHTLLIVDDDEALAKMLCWAFEDLGYRVITAADCRSAYESLGDFPPGYALIDFRLPDGDGHTLWRELARRLPDLKSVLMSADRTAARATMGQNPETPPFIEKPIRPSWIDRYFTSENGPSVSLP